MKRRRRALRPFALAVGGLAALACAHQVGQHLPSASPSGPAASAAPAAGADAGPAAQALTAGLRPLREDPRLVAVFAKERAKDLPGARAAFVAARDAAVPTFTPGDAARWAYLEGRLALAANDPSAAATSFDAASAFDGPLRQPALLRAAQAHARAGHTDDALARARGVAEGTPFADDARTVIAEALEAKGDRRGAAPLWRASLADRPRGPRWVDTAVRLARALVDDDPGEPRARGAEAEELTTRVLVEAPKPAANLGVEALRARAASLAGHALRPLSTKERARQAQALLDTGEPRRTVDVADGVMSDRTAADVDRCRAATLRAQASSKLPKPSTVDAWEDAVRLCDREPELVTVLYQAAKAVSGKRPDRGVELFAKVEERFATHRLADDARLRAAWVLAQRGEVDASRRLLESVPTKYPDGDMGREALLRAGLLALRAGEPDAARAAFERVTAIARPGRDDPHPRAVYFLGRLAEDRGDLEHARARYAEVIERAPLTFPMLLAYGRLAARDEPAARKAVDDALARAAAAAGAERLVDDGDAAPEGAAASPAVADPAGFSPTTTALLEVDDLELARRDEGAPNGERDALVRAAIFERVGHPEIAHAHVVRHAPKLLERWPVGEARVAWELAFPRAFGDLVLARVAEARIPTSLAWGIMREESGFVAEAKSPAQAFGLMQLIVPTARLVASGTGLPSDEDALRRPEVNVALGTRLLGSLRPRHKHPALAIAAYNAGSGAVDRWVKPGSQDLDVFVESIPYEETRLYVKKVLASQAAYAWLYEREALDEVLRLPPVVGP